MDQPLIKQKVHQICCHATNCDQSCCERQIHQEKQYLDLLQNVLDHGDIRKDRTGVGTKSLSGCTLKFDLRKEFPLITTKKMFVRASIEELLFFISGKTDTKILEEKGIKIWSQNTSAQYLKERNLPWLEGDMGPGYGFQWRHYGAKYTGCTSNYAGEGIDQLTNVINNIKTDPYSRRHIVSAWSVSDINLMALPPCHCFFQFIVVNGVNKVNKVNKENKEIPTYLDCILTQRSGDLFLGIPFNIASYAFLMHMIAHLTDLKPRYLIHHINDAHIYLDHTEQVKKQLKRQPLKWCTISFKEKVDKIDDFKLDHIIINDYKCHPSIKAKMAV